MLTIRRQFLPAHRLLSVRAPDWPPFDTDVRTVHAGRHVVMVQLLARPGRHTGPRNAAGHMHADAGHDVHRTACGYSSRRLRESNFKSLIVWWI